MTGGRLSQLGANWQPEDLCGQEVSADHARGRVCVQTDDRKTDAQQDKALSSAFDGVESRREAENKAVRLEVTGCVSVQ